MTKFKRTFLYLVLFLIAGFFWWVVFLFNTLPKNYYHPEESNLNIDKVAIVVLTGGKGRIEKGIQLLVSKKAKKLFISGVFLGTDLKTKYNQDQKFSNLYNCCVSYGERAKNTLENAHEVKKWLIKNDEIKKIILVSSYYHLPRSLIIFEKTLPNRQIVILPAQKKKDISENFFFHIKLMFFEYFKVFYSIIFY